MYVHSCLLIKLFSQLLFSATDMNSVLLLPSLEGIYVMTFCNDARNGLKLTQAAQGDHEGSRGPHSVSRGEGTLEVGRERRGLLYIGDWEGTRWARVK